MISLELSKQLKSAGLEWRPKEGDFVYDDFGGLGVIAREDEQFWFLSPSYTRTTCIGYDYHECEAWAPRLDQLLTEIEARGYKEVYSGPGECTIYFAEEPYRKTFWADKHSDSREDAAAKALLWILKEATNEPK